MKSLLLACALAAPCLMLAPAAYAAVDEAALCAEAKSVVEDQTAKSPFMIDDITQSTGASYDCAGKSVHFKRNVTVPSAQLQADWQNTLQGNWNKAICSPPWDEAIKSGWEVSADWSFPDGETHTFKAVCE